MIVRKPIASLIIFSILTCPAVSATQSAGSATYIDPNFRQLLIHHPRNKPVINPSVPRISPAAALILYKSGKAIFIAAGQMAIKANLPGAIPLTEKLRLDPSPLKKVGNIPIVMFCH